MADLWKKNNMAAISYEKKETVWAQEKSRSMKKRAGWYCSSQGRGLKEP